MHELSAFDAAAILIVLASALSYVDHRFLRLPSTVGLTAPSDRTGDAVDEEPEPRSDAVAVIGLYAPRPTVPVARPTKAVKESGDPASP